MSEILIYFLIFPVYFIVKSLIEVFTDIENLKLRQDKLEKRVDKHLIREIDDGK